MSSSPTSTARVSWLRRETTSGILLLAAAAIALAWANSPWRDGYATLSGLTLGPASLHLDLTLAHWASDGLLAIFFLVVGLELSHELRAGALRHPRTAAVPMLAAVGGMVVPALVLVAVVTLLGDPGARHGWAIPTATDIAFALGVLAVFGRGLPRALRLFLLTLAVVDDLLAIVVIAVFYSSDVALLPLVGAAGCVAAFAVVVRRTWARWWLLAPLGVAAWALLHASGVHATVAAVAVGLCVPAGSVPGETEPRTLRYEHLVRPWSTALALPVFAFFAAGVSVVGTGEGGGVVAQPVVAGVATGLVLGKVSGVLGTTWLVTRLTRLRLPDAVGLRDLLPVGLLCGIGFTVSLLIAELSFPDGEHTAGAKIAVLIGSLVSAVLGAALLRWDARRARSADMNEDGEPDTDAAVM
ncbi:Na+/H+ antiporter NhaA [Salana multivorans]|uniref:Na+/H+ antiporter NhaA n=1 Tax=Salana multivorans TaxID=120377 RepID=UPI000B006A70|nr:Na+/H+ antiporter NhaA [Salana multivorans]